MANDAAMRIQYSFLFEDGSRKEFDVSLECGGLNCAADGPTLPDWVSLRQNQCPSCPLSSETTPCCPAALQLAHVVTSFADCTSFEEVSVTVRTEQRTYTKRITLQLGVSALIGLVMATSGCPVLEYLKPMARFHLPFASAEETEYRMVSMYLVAQLKRQAKGLDPDWSMEGLKGIYAKVTEINASFAKRLREAASNDANMNALVNLDCFAKSAPWVVKTKLNDLDPLFEAYLR